MSRTAIFLSLVFILVLGVWMSPWARHVVHNTATDVQEAATRISREQWLALVNAPPSVDLQCFARLSARAGTQMQQAEAFERGDGCIVENAVNVSTLAGINLRPGNALMRCEVAEALANWLEQDAAPAAVRHFASPIRQMRHIGTYNCRSIGGSPDVLSQHAFANGIDVAEFTLQNGTRTRLERDWPDADVSDQDASPKGRFWRDLQATTCAHFNVSLGPNFNAAHHDHFHLDLGPMQSCK